MLIKELMPMAAPDTVARTPEEAIEALQSHADATLLGLSHGPRFAGLKALRAALLELGWAMESVPIDDDGVTTHLKATITGCKEKTDGWRYAMILEEVDGLVQVRSAKVLRFGERHDPALKKAYLELLAERKKA